MGDTTGISWTQRTWNPWTGCHKVSPGCKNCYMFSEKRRYGQEPDIVTRSKTTFNAPLKWKDPALVFTCSWSDWFIEEADAWRPEAYDIIERTPHLTYQILTKRPERVEKIEGLTGEPRDNVWLGVSVEDRKYGLPRIDILRQVPAALRFLSIEPLLEDLGDFDLSGIGWVIVGGESGSSARYFSSSWIVRLRDRCRERGIPLFIKQFGAKSDLVQLKQKKGDDPSEWPVEWRIQQMPSCIPQTECAKFARPLPRPG